MTTPPSTAAGQDGSVSIPAGTLTYIFSNHDFRKVDYVSNGLKALTYVVGIAIISVVVSIIAGGVYIAGGVLFAIIYVPIAGYIQGHIASGRRDNPSFNPIVRNQVPYGDVVTLKLEKSKVTVKSKKRGSHFEKSFDFKVSNQDKGLLQSHLTRLGAPEQKKSALIWTELKGKPPPQP